MTNAWMDAAWSHIGVRETAGKGATAEIVGMYAKAGHAEVTSDEVPWCAAFVGSCLKDASLPNTGSLLARSYLEYGTKLDEPKVGAIAIFKRGAPPSGHVAFVTGWGNGSIRVLGGNQGDKVCEANYPESALLGLRWPPVKVAAEPNPLPRSGTAWGSLTALGGGFGMMFHDWVGAGMNLALDVMKVITDLSPLRDALINSGANTKSVFFGLVTFGTSYALSRRVKAAQEGKAG